MTARSSNGIGTTTKGTLASESERSDDAEPSTFALASESNPHEWFYAAAQHLLGKDAGYALHRLTGYPASSCYAYVAHDPRRRRRPPEHFLRVLFHLDEGEPFHAAYMDGCTWWSRRQRDAKLGRKLRALRE